MQHTQKERPAGNRYPQECTCTIYIILYYNINVVIVQVFTETRKKIIIKYIEINNDIIYACILHCNIREGNTQYI